MKNLGVRKGAWSEEEDLRLRKCIGKYGEGKWHQIPLRAGLNRCRKSCRLRWLNYLHPNIKRGEFKDDQIDLIIRLHKLLGNRWSLISGRLPGRTSNDIKNYWNSHLSRKVDLQPKEINPEPERNEVIRPRPWFSPAKVYSRGLYVPDNKQTQLMMQQKEEHEGCDVLAELLRDVDEDLNQSSTTGKSAMIDLLNMVFNNIDVQSGRVCLMLMFGNGKLKLNVLCAADGTNHSYLIELVNK
ncbi:hypothetical protein ACHQM5_025701 [Ranunculus cassubicifolius]